MTPIELAEEDRAKKFREQIGRYGSLSMPQLFDLLDELTALRQAKEGGGQEESVSSGSCWRDISTAPKGGQWILVWWPTVTDAPFTAYRDGSKWYPAPGSLIHRDTWDDAPTHWMPLPEPPGQPENNNPPLVPEAKPPAPVGEEVYKLREQLRIVSFALTDAQSEIEKLKKQLEER